MRALRRAKDEEIAEARLDEAADALRELTEETIDTDNIDVLRRAVAYLTKLQPRT